MRKLIGIILLPKLFILTSCASVTMLSDAKKIELEDQYKTHQEMTAQRTKKRGVIGVDLEDSMRNAVKVASHGSNLKPQTGLRKYLQKSERSLEDSIPETVEEKEVQKPELKSDTIVESNKEKTIDSSSEEVVAKEKPQVDEVTTTSTKKVILETKSKDFNLQYDKKLYKFWIKYFTKRDRARFIRHLKNGEKYRKLVRRILKEEGVPEDLFYVALIESGYNSRIRSRAKATGYWQFMKGTGKNYGLRVNRAVDERTNIHKATRAAAHYFKDLYNIFGSWELALCAYNAGEYRIIGAIRKGNTRKYHELVKKRLLPKETSYYIPKVIAARHLSKNLHKLNLKKVYKDPASQIYEDSKVYEITGRTTLKNIATDLGIPYKTVKKLNHDFRYKNLKGTRRNPLKIVLPMFHRGMKTDVSKIKRSKVYQRSVASTQSNGKSRIYKVRRGDNLTLIARRFGVKLSDLKYLNSLNRKGKILVGQRIKIPKPKGKVYVVRRGDNLSIIARKFKTSISRLLTANGLKSGKIFPRQRLLIPTKDKDS